MRSRFRLVLGVAASVLSLVVAGCGSSSHQGTGGTPTTAAVAGVGTASLSPFHIMVVTDFSGPQSFIGKILLPFVKSACDQINAAGGVMGHKCEYATADDKSDPADGAIALRTALASTSKVVVVSVVGTATSGAEIPIAMGSDVLVESSSGATAYIHPVQLFGAGPAQRFYTTGMPDILLGYALALGVQKQGIMHPAVIATDGADAASTLQGLASGFSQLGITPSITLKVAPDETSYGTEVQRVLAAHPDGLVLQLTDAQSEGTFMSDYVTAAGALKLPVVSDATLVASDYYGALKHSLSTQEMTTYFHPVAYTRVTSPTPNNPAAAALGHILTSQNLAPLSILPNFSPLFDAWIIAALAMDEAHSLDPNVFGPYMAKIDATSDTAGKTIVYTYAQGVQAIAAGKQIAYWGASGPLNWNAEHVTVPGFSLFDWSLTSGGPTLGNEKPLSTQTLNQLLK